MNIPKILAIPGSTRRESSNGLLIQAITGIAGDRLDIRLFTGLADLPHFNPDLDADPLPSAVLQFRQALRQADGILICTPEYAMGLPGSLKNALDWTVSSMEFSGKPVAAITASLSGEKAHASLLDTLRIIEAKVDDHELLISYIKTKVSNEGVIHHEETRQAVAQLVDRFVHTLRHQMTGITS
jgi:chromate reductase, NAD(P)H dehydrogenase (quinone)